MGQKSNPFFLRLGNTNQHFQYCWFGDYNYTAQFIENCRIGAYIQNVYQQIGSGNPVILLKRGREQVEMALFMAGRLGSKRTGNRQRRGFSFPGKFRFQQQIQVPEWQKERDDISPKRAPLQEYREDLFRSLLHSVVASGERILLKGAPLQLRALLLEGRGGEIPQRKGIFSRKAPRALESRSSPINQSVFPTPFWGSSIPTTEGRNVFERLISRQLQTRCKVHFVKCPSSHQNPLFLAEQVVRSLQERVAFRHIKHRLIREISKNSAVKGIRITCSGRVAARSKKAQKARRESIQWGETSLHVFSELVHFAQSGANTTFGKVGVKVWICYRAL